MPLLFLIGLPYVAGPLAWFWSMSALGLTAKPPVNEPGDVLRVRLAEWRPVNGERGAMLH